VLIDGGAGATANDTLVGAESVTGSVLGCGELAVLLTAWPSLVSPSDGPPVTCRFGFFGAIAAVDASEPDFLSLTVAFVVDILLPSLSLEPSDFSPPAVLPLLSPLAPTPSPLADAEDCDDVVVDVDDEGDWMSEPADEGEPVDESDDDEDEPAEEDDESVEELADPESVGSAHATPGALATATPTPKATAKPPTRPTYVAYPMTTLPGPEPKHQPALQKHRQPREGCEIR